MADDSEAQPAPEEDEVQAVALVGDQDWFLQQIIEAPIHAGVEMGMTLTVGGSTISGLLISGQKYFELFGDAVAGASQSEDDVASVMAKAYRKLATIYEKPEGAPDDWSPPAVSYIHLKDARIWSPGQPALPTNTGLLWRGRLSSIGGWALGKMGD